MRSVFCKKSAFFNISRVKISKFSPSLIITFAAMIFSVDSVQLDGFKYPKSVFCHVTVLVRRDF